MEGKVNIERGDRFKDVNEIKKRLPRGYGVVVYYDNNSKEVVVYDDPKFIITEGRYLAYNFEGAKQLYGWKRVTCMRK
ncbi:MAG TPA: hypothetical protein ENL06_03440 [Candidatus Portnoybacteria bacterium]|nr:hypothetical protein [Candidatus Portnoybacteria bacterium]